MRWFDAEYGLLPVVAVSETAIGWGLNLPQCPQMWTLIVVSTNVDTILYLYLRLLTLLVLHHTRSSITIEVISRDSYCFPTRFFVTFSVYFLVQMLKPIKRRLIVIFRCNLSGTICTCTIVLQVYTRHSQICFFLTFFFVIFLCFFLGIRLICNLLQQQGTCNMTVDQTLPLPRDNYRIRQLLDSF